MINVNIPKERAEAVADYKASLLQKIEGKKKHNGHEEEDAFLIGYDSALIDIKALILVSREYE